MGEMSACRRSESFPPLAMCLGEERIELCVSLVRSWKFPPIFNIVDEDARSGDGGDGGVEDLFGGKFGLARFGESYGIGDRSPERV